MTDNKKATYIIIGVVIIILAIPVLVTLLGLLGWLFYMSNP